MIVSHETSNFGVLMIDLTT